jgi:hypothetical protein
MMQTRRHWLGGVAWGGAASVSATANTKILRFARTGDWNLDFAYHLLRHALAAAGSPWSLEASRERMSQTRASAEIFRGNPDVDFIWTMTSPERERTLLPVRIPIFRGLFGWRVLLVRRGDSARFAGVRTLADLKPFRLLQGHDWPDSDILEANDLTVVRSANFDSLFPMLVNGRGDALPRSVLEVANELKRLGGEYPMELEPTLLLRYPAPVYYFVSPKRPDLAAHFENALRALMVRGESARMLREFYADSLAMVNLPKRHVLDLKNPLLPSATPTSDKSLWFTS